MKRACEEKCNVTSMHPLLPERVFSSTQQQPLWEMLGLQKWAPCGCGCGLQKGQSPGQKVRSIKRHTRNPEEGPGRQVPDGDTQGGLLERGCLSWPQGQTSLTTRVEVVTFQAGQPAHVTRPQTSLEGHSHCLPNSGVFRPPSMGTLPLPGHGSPYHI